MLDTIVEKSKKEAKPEKKEYKDYEDDVNRIMNEAKNGKR